MLKSGVLLSSFVIALGFSATSRATQDGLSEIERAFCAGRLEGSKADGLIRHRAAQVYADISKGLPHLEIRYNLDRPSVGKVALLLDGEPAAGLEYVLLHEGEKGEQLVLLVDDLMVEQKFRRLNLSKLMLAAVLIKHPQVQAIDGEMMEENIHKIDEELGKGMSLEEAVQATPAFKIRRTLGFSRIDTSKLREGRKHRGRYFYISVLRD